MKKLFIKYMKFILTLIYSKKGKISIENCDKVSINVIKKTGKYSKFRNDVICTGKVKIGIHTAINGPGTRIVSKLNEVEIGSYCSIASNVIIQEYYHKYDRISTYYFSNNVFKRDVLEDVFSKGKIIIEDDVWIGSNSVILSGVRIGRGSIVGAGSVVSKDIEPYTICAGNPARIIKNRFSSNTIKILEEIKWWKWDEEKLKENEKIFYFTEEEILENKDWILKL